MDKFMKISAAVLAFSRLDTLVELVDSLKNQTKKIDEIIIVYQGSQEDIWNWITQQEGIHCVRQENIGSAGGFSSCISIALDRGADWVWLFDDDAIPNKDAFEVISRAEYIADSSVGFIIGRTVDRNGNTYMTPILDDAKTWFGSVVKDGFVKVVEANWLGLMVSRSAIVRCGLPLSEYFLWDEDREFTYRIAQHFNCFCAVESVSVHYQNPNFNPNVGSDSIKYNFWVRNRVNTIRSKRIGFFRKFIMVLRWAFKVAGDVVSGYAKPVAIIYLLRGVFAFRPKIRRYTASDV